jgi:hypothetical protein
MELSECTIVFLSILRLEFEFFLENSGTAAARKRPSLKFSSRGSISRTKILAPVKNLATIALSVAIVVFVLERTYSTDFA